MIHKRRSTTSFASPSLSRSGWNVQICEVCASLKELKQLTQYKTTCQTHNEGDSVPNPRNVKPKRTALRRKFVCERLPYNKRLGSDCAKLRHISLPRRFHSKNKMNRRPETILAIRLAPRRCCETFKLEVVKYGQGAKIEV